MNFHWYQNRWPQVTLNGVWPLLGVIWPNSLAFGPISCKWLKICLYFLQQKYSPNNLAFNLRQVQYTHSGCHLAYVHQLSFVKLFSWYIASDQGITHSLYIHRCYCFRFSANSFRKRCNSVEFNGQSLSKLRGFIQRGLISEYFIKFIGQSF